MMTRRPRPDVVYVHQGAQRIYDIVASIAAAGYSCRLLAGYYHYGDGLPERLLRRFPGSRARRLEARLRRRHSDRLDPASVERSWVQEILMGIEVATKPVLPHFVVVRNAYIDIRSALRVLMLRPRVVIACDTTALYTLRAAKRIGAVAVLDQVIGHLAAGNRVLEEERRLHPEIAGSYRPAPARQVRRCIAEAREADRILAPSPYVRDSLIEIGADPARISLLPYGADLSKFGRQAAPPTPPFRILFAGQIGLRKGVLYLLEAVRRAGFSDAEVILLGNIDGDGAWLAPYRGLFRHIAHLPHGEIPPVFASAHVYVFPSLHEGSTVSIYEAMATGLPVVATPNSGSFVSDGADGYIVPLRDVEALCDRMTRLHDDPDLRERMGAAARRHAAEFSWDAYSARIAMILRDLLK
ncbi:MAG: glycosyltransferase family 4 protein [Rhodospirillaceae bacterium]